MRKVGLMVCDYNVGGTKLYEKLGFKLEGRLRGEMRYDGEGGMIWSTERWRENGRIAMGMLKWKWRSLDRVSSSVASLWSKRTTEIRYRNNVFIAPNHETV